MSYRNLNNDQIVPAAKRGLSAETKNGNFWTVPGFTGNQGAMPSNLYYALRAINSLGVGHRIEQAIYSYSTPIAMLIEGVWIVPSITYSVTTSTKHRSQLWRLSNVRHIPADATVADIERVIAGKMLFTDSGTIPGPNWELD